MRFQTTSPTMLAEAADVEDLSAWRRFEACYRPLILSYARRLGLQLADAEDVTQDVLLGLSRVMPRFEYDRSRGRFRSYLGQAVRHGVIRLLRRRGRTAVPGGAAIDALEAAEDREWDRQWRLHHCRRALESIRESLSPAHQAVLDGMLRGEESTVTAAAHDLAPASVRKIRERLRSRLREAVSRQMRAEDPTSGAISA